MNLDEEKAIVESARKCQRNWDLTKEVLPEHIEHWIHIAKHSPSKHDEGYYNLYVITNKELIQDLLDYTWGFSIAVLPNDYRGVARNTQMGANVYLLFTLKQPQEAREIATDGIPYSKQHPSREENACTAAGIAGGMISYSANRLGYKTGYNRNHDNPVWHTKLNIGNDERIIFGIGIGHPQEGRERNDTDETQFYVGDPKDGNKYSITDPYIIVDGVQQPTLNKVRYKTFSKFEKNVKVTRFE